MQFQPKISASAFSRVSDYELYYEGYMDALRDAHAEEMFEVLKESVSADRLQSGGHYYDPLHTKFKAEHNARSYRATLLRKMTG